MNLTEALRKRPDMPDEPDVVPPMSWRAARPEGGTISFVWSAMTAR